MKKTFILLLFIQVFFYLNYLVAQNSSESLYVEFFDEDLNQPIRALLIKGSSVEGVAQGLNENHKLVFIDLGKYSPQSYKIKFGRVVNTRYRVFDLTRGNIVNKEGIRIDKENVVIGADEFRFYIRHKGKFGKIKDFLNNPFDRKGQITGFMSFLMDYLHLSYKTSTFLDITSPSIYSIFILILILFLIYVIIKNTKKSKSDSEYLTCINCGQENYYKYHKCQKCGEPL